jgi:cbb3-type cytochrome oxidase subunit 1
MVHRNRWFTELNSMVIFHGKLLNSQRVNAIYPDYMVMGQNSGALGCPGYLEIAGIYGCLFPQKNMVTLALNPCP